MTKQERKKLQEDRDFLYRFALQFLTLERQINAHKQRIAECDEEAARLTKEVRSLEQTMRQLTTDFGNCLDQFVADYDAGVFTISITRIV